MPQKLTLPEFAAQIKTANPVLRDYDDETIVNSFLKSYPEEASRLERRSPAQQFYDKTISTGLRVAPAIVGGAAGSVLGPVGTAGGGAAGAGLGEWLAEAYEQGRGDRTRINPTQIGVQAALGAVPVAGKAGSFVPTVAKRLLQGGVLGGTATAATKLAEGETPTARDVLTGAGLGAVLGGTGGAVESRVASRNIPQIDRVLPKLQQLEAERAATAASPSLKELAKEKTENAVTRFVNQFRPIERFVKEGGAQNLPGRTNPVKRFDIAYGGTPGMIQDFAGEYRGVFKEAEGKGLQKTLSDYLDLQGFSTGVRTLREKARRALATGDKAAARDYFKKLYLGGGLPVGYRRKTVGQDLGRFYMQPNLQPQDVFETQRLGQKVFDLNRKVLDITHQAGIISDDVYTKLTLRPDTYVPLERIMDEVTENFRRNGLDLPTQHVLYSLEGSARTTKDPISASVRRAAIAIQESEKNKATQSLVNLRSRNQFFQDNIIPLQGNSKVSDPDFGRVSVFVDGKVQHYAVPKPVADVVKNVDPQTADLLAKSLLGWGNRTLRTFATQANLAFSVPNLIRDVTESALYDPNVKLARIAQDWVQAFGQVWRQSPEYRKFLQSGGAFSTLQKTISDPKRFLEGEQRVLDILHPVKTVETLNNALEEATKLSFFNRQLKGRADTVEAAWRTRRFGGSPDFARHGTSSRTLSMLVPFVNAQIQGLTRPIGYFAQNPKKLGYVLAGATGAAALLASWNNQFVDPDGTPSMKRVSDREKQQNFIVLRPDLLKTSDGLERHGYIKIPKAHVVQTLMNPIQTLLDTHEDNKIQAVLDLGSSMLPGAFQIKKDAVVKSVGRGIVASLNPVIKTPIEQGLGSGGVSTFQNFPIVPSYLQDVAPSEQVRPDTSPAVAAVIRTMNRRTGTEFSPIRAEAALKNFFPGLGDVALSAANRLFSQPQQELARKPQTFEKDEAVGRLPIVGPVAKRFLTSTLDQAERDWAERFYNALTKAREVQRTVSVKSRTNPQELKEYLQDPEVRFYLGRVGSLEKVSEVLTELRRAQNHAAELRILKSVQPLLTAGK